MRRKVLDGPLAGTILEVDGRRLEMTLLTPVPLGTMALEYWVDGDGRLRLHDRRACGNCGHGYGLHTAAPTEPFRIRPGTVEMVTDPESRTDCCSSGCGCVDYRPIIRESDRRR